MGISAVEAGMSGSGFMQVNAAAAMLRKAVAANTQATDDDRQTVLAFLSGSSQGESSYVPKGGEVTGIMKQMKESFAENLASVEKEESAAQKTHDELVKAKK